MRWIVTGIGEVVSIAHIARIVVDPARQEAGRSYNASVRAEMAGGGLFVLETLATTAGAELLRDDILWFLRGDAVYFDIRSGQAAERINAEKINRGEA